MPSAEDATNWAISFLPPYVLPILVGLKEFWDECDTGTRLVIAFFVGVLIFCAVTRQKQPVKGQSRGQEKDQELVLKPPSNNSIWRRLWWMLYPPHDLMKIDGLVIDRTRKPHCSWYAPTGGGKSSAVAAVRVNGERPTVIAVPALSEPMIQACRRQNGFRWTACESEPIDFLIGSPQRVGEFLTEVFRSGGIGTHKRAARLATTECVRRIDARGEPRSLQAIGEELGLMVLKNKRLEASCGLWVDRYLDLADQFGDSIGAGGIDLSVLLRQGKTVLCDVDEFAHRSLGGDVVALVLGEANRLAKLVPGGFRLIFEEAGQLGDRVDLVEGFHRSGRRIGVMCDDLTHAESDLIHHGNEGIVANLGTRVYFSQETKNLRRLAAERLDIDEIELHPLKLPDFHAWIAHGKLVRKVHFDKPRKPLAELVSANGHHSPGRTDTENGHTKNGHRYSILELPRDYDDDDGEDEEQQQGPLALPPPTTTLKKLLAGIYQEGDCERWLGKHDRAGHRSKKEQCAAECQDQRHARACYGLVWVDGTWQKVHRLRWELAYGPIPFGDDGKKLTVDHQRTCAKDCSKLTHLSLCTDEENTRRAWRVGGHVASSTDQSRG